MAKIKINLPNGSTVEMENGFTVEQVLAALAAQGTVPAGAVATEAANGDYNVTNPTGTRKG
jgi:hypothetical protein